jgi:hypothetical protein
MPVSVKGSDSSIKPVLARYTGISVTSRPADGASQSARATRLSTGPASQDPGLRSSCQADQWKWSESARSLPMRIWAAFQGKGHGQRESCLLRLTCNRHGDHGFGFPVKQIVAENQNRPQSGLFAASDGVQIRPIDVTSQCSGQARSPKPCSANCVSSWGSSLANSRANRVRFSRLLSRFTADCSARLRFGYLPSTVL